MSYTLSDWARDKLQVRVRWQMPDGEWREGWLPVDLGDGLPSALFDIRAYEGKEPEMFASWLDGDHIERPGAGEE